MNLEQNGFFAELADCQDILIAGAGGGFDVYSGIPIYLALRRIGKTVNLANLSFSSLNDPNSLVTNGCYRVTKETEGSESYFPERTLCRWFDEFENTDVAVYSFPQTGVVPLQTAYQFLIEELKLDAIVLVDGGTDSLMRGDENGLGTPTEDLTSLVAVNRTDVRKKILSCIGFGVDRFHGVCHAQFLEAVAELTKQRAFLGSFSVLPQMKEAQQYASLVQYSSEKTESRPSIVNTSIASSMAGHYGDHHATSRTQGSKLWISPLMSMYWFFQVDAVVQRNLYADRIVDTEEFYDVMQIIRAFRQEIVARPWEVIPD